MPRPGREEVHAAGMGDRPYEEGAPGIRHQVHGKQMQLEVAGALWSIGKQVQLVVDGVLGSQMQLVAVMELQRLLLAMTSHVKLEAMKMRDNFACG